MPSKSDYIKIMINDEENEVIKDLFASLKTIYQNNLESIRGSEVVFQPSGGGSQWWWIVCRFT